MVVKLDGNNFGIIYVDVMSDVWCAEQNDVSTIPFFNICYSGHNLYDTVSCGYWKVDVDGVYSERYSTLLRCRRECIRV